MSFQITPFRLLTCDVSHSSRSVYLALSSFANDGVCWPKKQQLALRANVSINTLDKCLAELVVAGLIEIEIRKPSSNKYRLIDMKDERMTDEPPPLEGEVTPPPNTQDPKSWDVNTPEVGVLIPQKLGYSKNYNQELDPQNQIHSFAHFWERYPRKRGKRKAEEAWHKALKRVSAEIIMRGLEEQLASESFSDQIQYIPYPSTWLNQDRWEDEVEVTQESVFTQHSRAALEQLMQAEIYDIEDWRDNEAK